MKNFLYSVSTLLLLSQPILADFIGVEIGGVQWNPTISGDVQYSGKDIDLEKDLGYDDNIQSNYFWATLEHPVPFLPNAKIIHTSFNEEAIQKTTVIFNDKTYSGDIKSEITFDQTDFILYYEILDNWVNLDLGLNVKYLDGVVTIEDSEKAFDEYIPMLYAKGKFEFPFSGVSAGFDFSYISLDKNSFMDIKGELSYESSIGLGVVLGYRVESLNIDDINDFSSDIDIEGAYAGLFYHF